MKRVRENSISLDERHEWTETMSGFLCVRCGTNIKRSVEHESGWEFSGNVNCLTENESCVKDIIE